MCVNCVWGVHVAHRRVWPVWPVRRVFYLYVISVASALGTCEDFLCGRVPGMWQASPWAEPDRAASWGRAGPRASGRRSPFDSQVLSRKAGVWAPERPPSVCRPALLPAARPRAPRAFDAGWPSGPGAVGCGSGMEVRPGDLRDGSWGGLGRLSSEVTVIATDGWGRGAEGAGNGVIAGVSCPLRPVLRRLLYRT